MAHIVDPKDGTLRLVSPCRVCLQPIYFGTSERGRRCPYDVVNGQPTRVSHFTTGACVKAWKAAHPKAKA